MSTKNGDTSGRKRRPFKVLNRMRTMKKGLMAGTLEELVRTGKEKLSYMTGQDVVVVLEEDGTEVKEDVHFQTLEDNTELILLNRGDRSSHKLISILLRLEFWWLVKD